MKQDLIALALGMNYGLLSHCCDHGDKAFFDLPITFNDIYISFLSAVTHKYPAFLNQFSSNLWMSLDSW